MEFYMQGLAVISIFIVWIVLQTLLFSWLMKKFLPKHGIKTWASGGCSPVRGENSKQSHVIDVNVIDPDDYMK